MRQQQSFNKNKALNKNSFKQEKIQTRKTSNKKRFKQESQHRKGKENTCESIFSNALSKAKSDVVYNMNEPEVKVNSDNIWFTVPTIETSEAIIVDEQESKIKTQTENICDSP